MDKEMLKKDFADFKNVFKTAKGVDIAKGVIKTITGKAACGLVALILVIGIASAAGGSSDDSDSSSGSKFSAATAKESDLVFELNESGDGLSVSLGIPKEGTKWTKIIIPDTHEGYPVTEIKRLYADDATSITFPKNLKKVCANAIDGLKVKSFTLKKDIEYGDFGSTFRKMETFTIEDGVKIVPAFSSYASKIKKITIPASVEIVKKHAFASCEELVDVEFMSESTKVDKLAFLSCGKLSVKSQQAIKKQPIYKE